MAGSLLLALSAIIFTVLIPWLTGSAINAIGAGDEGRLFAVALVIVGAGVARLVFSVARRLVAGKVSLGIEYDLRNMLYSHLQKLELGFFDRQQTGQLMSRLTVDLQSVRFFLGYGLVFVVQSTFTIILATIAMIIINPGLAALALIPVPFVVISAMRYGRRSRPALQEVQQRIAELTADVEENISGIRLVKAFAAETRQYARFGRNVTRVFDQSLVATRLRSYYNPLLGFLPSVGLAIVLLVGGHLVISDSLSIGDFTAFYAYLLMLIWPMRQLGIALAMAQRATASGARIFEILDRDPTLVNAFNAPPLPDGPGEVEFRDVTFSYTKEVNTLANVSFKIKPGTTVALVGATGSGKTTLIQLLPRLYDVDTGKVLIDGADVRNVDSTSLRRSIAVVSDDPFLFSASVRDNIAYGVDSATQEEIEYVCDLAQATQFISELPDGLDTRIGERGVILSAGQRQRVALARALLTSPRILILDDATSSVDASTELAIKNALMGYTTNARASSNGPNRWSEGRQRTTFVIAHRLATLSLADEIIVLENGRVTARGTHSELVDHSPLYAEIVARGSADGAVKSEALYKDCHALDGVEPSLTNNNKSDYGHFLHGPVAQNSSASAGSVENPVTKTQATSSRSHDVEVSSLPSHDVGVSSSRSHDHLVSRLHKREKSTESSLNEEQSLKNEVNDSNVILRQTEKKSGARLTTRLIGGLRSTRGRGRKVRGLFELLKPYRLRTVIMFVSLVLATLAALLPPLLAKFAIDNGIVPGDTTALNVTVALFIVSALVYWGASSLQTYLVGWIGQRVLQDLRLRIFAHLQKLSFNFYTSRPTGVVLSRLTNDIEALDQLVTDGIVTLFGSTLMLIGTAVILFVLDAELALWTFIIFPVLFIGSITFRAVSANIYRITREKIALVTATLGETLSGIRVVRSFAREKEHIKRFSQLNDENRIAQMKTVYLNAAYFPVIEFLSALMIAGILIYGGGQVIDDALTIGVLVAFIAALNNFFEPIQSLSQLYTTYQAGMAALDKIFELLDEEPDLVDAPNAINLPTIEGSVEFRDVNFSYLNSGSRKALDNVSLTISPGQTVALVGETGAGKTTIAKLIARFHDPSSGKVVIDGHDLQKITARSLRTQMGFVPQEPFLFSGTIAENIEFGKPGASLDEIEQIVKAVGSEDLVSALPEGYDTLVGERGVKLSAGQRQLLAFARALIRDPRILILDEATSNVDLHTEAKIEQAMRQLLSDRTAIIIAHRLSTIRNADKIIVIDHGRIIEEGSHDELISVRGSYWSLYQDWSTQNVTTVKSGLRSG